MIAVIFFRKSYNGEIICNTKIIIEEFFLVAGTGSLCSSGCVTHFYSRNSIQHLFECFSDYHQKLLCIKQSNILKKFLMKQSENVAHNLPKTLIKTFLSDTC